MRQTIIGLFFLNIFTIFTYAQNSTLQGYVFEDGNQRVLNAVTVKITQKGTNKFITNVRTNQKGAFIARLPVGYTYLLEAQKEHFLPQQIIITVKSTDQHKNIFAKIQMFRKLGHQVDELVVKAPELSAAEITEYGIDTKKITASANPEGVALANLVKENDIYAEITNATRLVDENYVDAADKELLKLQPMPTNYQSPVSINPAAPNSGPKINQDLPNPYDQKVVDKVIIPEPKFGETMVASANNNPRTRVLPANYTGYKIEFFTTLSALPATDEIFNRHGNIVLERKTNGMFSYLLGNFSDKNKAETFLQESLLDRYPTASLITYTNGQRQVAIKTKKVKTKPVSAPPR